MNDDDEKLRKEIIELESMLEAKRNTLFKARLYKLLGIPEQDLISWGVSNVVLDIYDNEWTIDYDHQTTEYDENNYNHDNDSETETELREKRSSVSFGKESKLFLKGKGYRQGRFKLYRNSRKEIRVINNDYNFELDTEEQLQLIRKYSSDCHIPEWFALKVFMYMCENDWNSCHIIQYLGTV
jgi:hypothetical protein